MKYAPVLIPTVCRYQHFRNCIESLSQCTWADKTDVFVAVDYPGCKEHWEGYRKIREYLENCGNMGFKSLNVTFREMNYFFSGKGNIGTLMRDVEKTYDRYIASEDDNMFASNFLVYMNSCLEAFEDDPDVVMVSGYSYPVEWDVSDGATCLKQNFNASVWGAGFWSKKRATFIPYIRSGAMLDDVSQVIRDKTYLRMTDASLREYIPASVTPWRKLFRFIMVISDIGLRAYLAVAGKYVITPSISKVRNCGFDGSGQYCQTIEQKENGNTAGTYRYSQQPIDQKDTFEIHLNTKDSLQENRDRLNRFDVRTPAQMMRTRLYLWLMTHFGVWAGKACAMILFPFDFGLRAWRKIWRTIRK